MKERELIVKILTILKRECENDYEAFSILEGCKITLLTIIIDEKIKEGAL